MSVPTDAQQPLPSPVSKLPYDVLLKIFHTNAYMGDDPPDIVDQPILYPPCRAINTARKTSQVNTIWRKLIVNSPTLWAALVDISMLDKAAKSWRDEVIRRTASAPLYVRGKICFVAFCPYRPWWLGFINTNWARVRILEIIVKGIEYVQVDRPFLTESDRDAADIDDYRRAFSFLSMPATSLESIMLVFEQVYDPFELPTDKLFGEHAPHLRNFYTQYLDYPRVTKGPSPTSLRQLCSLQIIGSGRRTISSVDVFYNVLSEMTCLEVLCLNGAIASPDISIYREPLNLPRLCSIRIREAARVWVRHGEPNGLTCWPLLNVIMPQPGCSLELRLRPSAIDEDVDISVLCRLVQNYLSVHNIPRLSLSTIPEHFLFTDTNLDNDHHGPGQQSSFLIVSIDQYRSAGNATDNVMRRLLEALPFPSFSHVADLCLRSSPFRVFNFAGFTGLFPSVKLLAATPETLHGITSSPHLFRAPVFPQLRSLSILRPPSEWGGMFVPSLSGILFYFVKILSDAPLSTFETNWISDWGLIKEDIDTLAGTRGLQIVWNIKQQEKDVTCAVAVMGSSKSIISWRASG